MAYLFEHSVNEELMPAVPAMSAEVDTRRVVTGDMFARLVAKSTNR